MTMQNTYSERIAQAIHEFLTNDDWDYYFDKEGGKFVLCLDLENQIRNVHYRILVGEDNYVVYLILPIGIMPDGKKTLTALAELLCRINYGLMYGCFEADIDTGNLRFRSFVDCDNSVPSMEVIRNSIYAPAVMVQQYSEAIVSVLFGDTNPKEAIERAEENEGDDE